MAYIDSIEVVGTQRKPLFPEKIIVRPLKHMDHAPILTTLESDGFNQIASRGPKYDWVYTLYYFMTTAGEEERKMSRFRLEIIT
jgi:hypothetical protein